MAAGEDAALPWHLREMGSYGHIEAVPRVVKGPEIGHWHIDSYRHSD